MNQPYIPLYVGDWMKDPKLSLCSPATRGVWIDLICRLHELDQGGRITANVQQLARLCRCSDVEMHSAITELLTTDSAEVYERNGLFTIICKRMRKVAELSAKRKQAGSKSAANREQNPDNESEDEGLLKVLNFSKSEGISQKDAEWFYWKGRGNGWTNSGKPMRDWKATLRSWNRAGYLPSQKQSANGQLPNKKIQKQPAPTGPAYDPIPPKREPTEEEIANGKRIANEAVEALREKFKMPT